MNEDNDVIRNVPRFVIEKAIWNEAIEAVIDKLDLIGHSTDKDIEAIRKLKNERIQKDK